MTPADLRAVGEALFGSRWQRELARALGVNHRLVVYWLSGERRLPTDLVERIDTVLITRITDLMAARRTLRQAAKEVA